MAGYKSDSPNKFLGLGTLVKNAGNIAKGIKNRDEYGGGLKGAIKGVAGEITGGTEKNRNEEINSKLDTRYLQSRSSADIYYITWCCSISYGFTN